MSWSEGRADAGRRRLLGVQELKEEEELALFTSKSAHDSFLKRVDEEERVAAKWAVRGASPRPRPEWRLTCSAVIKNVSLVYSSRSCYSLAHKGPRKPAFDLTCGGPKSRLDCKWD